MRGVSSSTASTLPARAVQVVLVGDDPGVVIDEGRSVVYDFLPGAGVLANDVVRIASLRQGGDAEVGAEPVLYMHAPGRCQHRFGFTFQHLPRLVQAAQCRLLAGCVRVQCPG